MLQARVSAFPLNQVAGNGLESLGPAAKGFNGGKGFFGQPRGVALALFHAIDGWPSGLFRGLILARGLAQVRRVHGQVQHVIDNLKSQSGLAAK